MSRKEGKSPNEIIRALLSDSIFLFLSDDELMKMIEVVKGDVMTPDLGCSKKDRN